MLFDDFLVLACDDLDDAVDRMLAVTRVDALGTVAEPEVAASLEAGQPLDLGPAHILGYAGGRPCFRR